MLEMRSYQADVIARVRATLRNGTRRILLCLPTGSGKTVLAAHILAAAAERGKRSWFCVHRRELLDQSVTTFIEAADIHTGIVSAGYPNSPLAPVQVCCVPSLARRLPALCDPDLIVWDEAHHVASRSWSDIAQAYPHAVHIGLTATPQRLDGRGLGAHFDALVCGPSTADLIASGNLSPYRFYAPGAAVNLDAVHRVGGDYHKRELAGAMEQSSVVGDALSHYQAHCDGGRALVFAWNIEASERIAAQFVAAGIAARHVDGETARAERMQVMREFRNGQVQVLCNVDLFGEGLDVPSVDAVFLLRATQSLGLYLQQVGRGLRAAHGKPFVRIFDHVNNWERHGLPDDARQWSLAGTVKRAREQAVAAKRCAQCFGVCRPSAHACPYCGALFITQAREVEQVDGVLQETDVDALRTLRGQRQDFYQQCSTLAEWIALEKKLRYKRGWGFMMHQRSALYRRRTASQAVFDSSFIRFP